MIIDDKCATCLHRNKFQCQHGGWQNGGCDEYEVDNKTDHSDPKVL